MEPLPRPRVLKKVSSQKHMQTFVSVERASRLQALSMRRVKQENRDDTDLRRILGHISVNRRSTEIMRTAIFLEDIADELDEDDEDIDVDDDSGDYFEEDFDEDSDDEFNEDFDEDSDDDIDDHESQGQSVTQDTPEIIFNHNLPSVKALIQPAGRAMIVIHRTDDTKFAGKPASTPQNLPGAVLATQHPPIADNAAMADIKRDWMYDVFDLHIDTNAHAKTLVLAPNISLLPELVVAQIWRIILESLAGLAKRDKKLDPMADARRLEAYGSSKTTELVGLGLQSCSSAYESFPPFIPAVT